MFARIWKRTSSISYLSLFLLLCIGLLIRLYRFSEIPNGLYWDELDAGYQAYSLFHTGRDYYGNNFSLFLQSYADFRAPLYIYSIIPFIFLTGLTEFSVRLPSVIFGSLSIVLIYFVSLEITKSKLHSLLTAAVLTFSIWHLHYSRIAFEGALLVFLLLIGLLGFLKGLNKHKWFYLSAVGFGLSMWAYSTAKLFVPLILISLLFIFRGQLLSQIKQLMKPLFLLCLLIIPLLFFNFFGRGGMRFNEIAIYTDPTLYTDAQNLRQQAIVTSNKETIFNLNTSKLSQLFINPFTIVVAKFSQNYLTAFSPEFLFIIGDPNLRHSPSIKSFGQFLLIESIAFYLGLIILFMNKKITREYKLMLILWLLTAPIASSLTREGGNHATRNLTLLIPIVFIISSFLNFLWVGKQRLFKLLYLSYCLVWLFSFGYFYYYYLTFYNQESAESYEKDLYLAAEIALENKANYQKIIIDSNDATALMAYLFKSAYNPTAFQSQIYSLQSPVIEDFKADRLDNIYFLPAQDRTWSFQENYIPKITEKTLYIVTQKQTKTQDSKKASEKLGSNDKLLDVINYPDGRPMLFIIEHNPVDIK